MTTDKPMTNWTIDAGVIQAEFGRFSSERIAGKLKPWINYPDQIYQLLNLRTWLTKEERKQVWDEVTEEILQRCIKLNYSQERLDGVFHDPLNTVMFQNELKNKAVRKYFDYLIKNNLKLEI